MKATPSSVMTCQRLPAAIVWTLTVPPSAEKLLKALRSSVTVARDKVVTGGGGRAGRVEQRGRDPTERQRRRRRS